MLMLPQPAYHCPRYLSELSLIRPYIRLFVRVFTHSSIHSFIHSDIHYMLVRQQSGLKMLPSFSLFAARRRTRYVGSDRAHIHIHIYTYIHTHLRMCSCNSLSSRIYIIIERGVLKTFSKLPLSLLLNASATPTTTASESKV